MRLPSIMSAVVLVVNAASASAQMAEGAFELTLSKLLGTTAVNTLANTRSTVFAGLDAEHDGSGWLAFVHPDDRAGALADWARARRSKKPFRRVERKLTKAGDWRWVEFAAVPLLDGHEVREWICALTDVHDRLEAEMRLRDSEARYRAMVDALASIVWRADNEGRILKATGWTEFSGQAPDEYRGHGWLDALHEDDRERVATEWWRHAGAPAPFTIEYRARHVSGAFRWVSVRATALLDDAGGVREWIGTIRDINEEREAEARIRQGERRYRAIVEATSSIIWRTDAQGYIQAAYAAGPFPDFTHSFDGWAELVHPDDLAASSAAWHASLAEARPLDIVERKRTSDGSYRYCHVRGQPIRDETGRIVEWIGAVTDIHEQVMAQRGLERSERRLSDLLAALPVAVYTTDAEGVLTYFNEAAAALWARRPKLGCDRWCGSLVLCGPDGDPLAHGAYPVAQAIENGALRIEASLVRADGSRVPILAHATPLFDAEGRTAGAVNVLLDLSERKDREREIWRTANHDTLTGVANRSLFKTALASALHATDGGVRSLALVLVDLDGFKEVNDTFGHQAGDAYLRKTAEVLGGFTGEGGLVARIGGDEFALVLLNVAGAHAAFEVAQRVAAAMRFVLPRDDRAIFGRASVGVALYPDHRTAPEELIKAADVALYTAKASARGAAAIFDEDQAQDLERRVRIVGAARDAADAGRFVPFYQPKVSITTGAVVGFEALARWVHPDRGLLGPAAFGAAFEVPDVAARIGAAMVAGVVRDLRAWLDAGLAPGRIAINLSSAEFADEALASRILDSLAAAGLEPRHLEVEVTETVLLGRSTERVARILDEFQRAGVTVALDDFGTGYASLTHLKQFAVDSIKVDRSFVTDIVTDPDDAAIVAAVVGLGRALELDVVAEGVETAAQLEALDRLGCGFAQGYFFAKPMASSRVPWFLADNEVRSKSSRPALARKPQNTGRT